MTPHPSWDLLVDFPDDELVSSPTVVPPEESAPEVPMADAPSHPDDWFHPDDVLSADRPDVPAPALPTITPPTDPSLGLRGLLAAVVPTQEPSLGLSGLADPGALAAEEAPTEVPAPPRAAARAAAAVAAVPIERVAPLLAVAFVCSLLVWAIVQVLT